MLSIEYPSPCSQFFFVCVFLTYICITAHILNENPHWEFLLYNLLRVFLSLHQRSYCHGRTNIQKVVRVSKRSILVEGKINDYYHYLG
ncbi:hypothetical protein P3L10_014278 [Capsicum annuum]